METDGGVAHVLEAEVRQLWDTWVGGEKIGGNRGRGRQKERDNKNSKQRRRKGRRKRTGLDTKEETNRSSGQGEQENSLLPVG